MKLDPVHVAALLLPLLLPCLSRVQAAFPTMALKAICTKQIHSPTTITCAPDGSGRLFVCDEPGKIWIIQDGMLLPTPFMDISSTATNTADRKVISQTTGYNERGLLGLAFHPGYANPLSPGYRKFYVNYVKPFETGDAAPLGPTSGTNPPPITGSAGVSVIAEFQVSNTNPNVALPSSERRILLYTQPQANHNGGQVEFGPETGPNGEKYLYIGVGDGGSQEDNDLGHTGGDNTSTRPSINLGNGQDRTRLFGKILRIDPLGNNGPGGQYGIPANNPFVGQYQSIPGHPEADGPMREEIYSYGMRNPWRFSFDKRPGGTNRLICGDVGGNRTEEVDIIVSGGNYGWRYKEGKELPTFSSGASINPLVLPPADVTAMIDPVGRYAHIGQSNVESPALPQLGLSVTGGYVYRGSAIPALQGKYIFGDYGSTSTLQTWNGRLMGLEETSPGSGVFTLTQAIPLLGSTNPVTGWRILCFGEDESGEIYIGMKTKAGVLQLDGGLPSGAIYKLVPIQSVTTTLTAAQDNTIFSEDVQLSENYSDGVGYLYAGRTGPTRYNATRRALVFFDLSSVPSSAVIQSAQLKMTITKNGGNAAGTFMTVHHVNETWGEGTSFNGTGGYGAPATTNDATWNYRFFNSSTWSVAGGNFNATASASVQLNDTVPTWSSSGLIADVQGWVTTSTSNAGWMIRGDETTTLTACQFSSKEQGGSPPALTITYDAPPGLTHFEQWLANYYPANFVGQYVNPNGDDDGDGIANQTEYAFGFSPVAKDDATTGLYVTTSPNESGGTFFTIVFRRDPLATDLTYLLQTSPDLSTWTTIAQSVGGAMATGSGLVSDTENISDPPFRTVSAQESLVGPPGSQHRFARLQILRTAP